MNIEIKKKILWWSTRNTKNKNKKVAIDNLYSIEYYYITNITVKWRSISSNMQIFIAILYAGDF